MRLGDRLPLMLLAAFAALAGFACGGGDDAGDPVSDEEWVAGFCEAVVRLDEAMPRVTPGPGGTGVTSEWLKSLAQPYRQFGDDLKELGPPTGMEAYFEAFVDATYETADLLAKGDLTVDAFRPLEEVEEPEDAARRFGPIALANPACQRANVTFGDEPPEGGATPSATPGDRTFAPPQLDYSAPAKFLEPGPQSTLSAASVEVLRREVLPAPGTGAARIHRWIGATFSTRADGGASIGQTNVNDLIRTRILSGCHDWALVMTATLRFFGYPAVMVDTAGLQWAADYNAGKTRSFSGHVFAEVLTNDGWMLVDCSGGAYTLDYDPNQPAINYTGAGDARGFFALYKGTDPASYGVTSSDVLQKRMEEFAAAYSHLEIRMPAYRWQGFAAGE